MAISGNKGEWSEIYTLFKLLGEGKVHAGDADMNELDIYYPILNVIREESKKYEYKPNVEQNIVVIDEDGNEYARISMDRFVRESDYLLNEIRSTSDRSFEVPQSEIRWRGVYQTQLADKVQKIKTLNGRGRGT